MLFSFNGIGLRHLGVRPTGEAGTVWVTTWVTFFFAPISPIRREKIRVIREKALGYQFQALQKSSLQFSEILKTYLFAWFLIPVGLFLPLILGIRELRQSLGIPDFLEIPMLAFGALWLIGGILYLKAWEEKRLRPAS